MYVLLLERLILKVIFYSDDKTTSYVDFITFEKSLFQMLNKKGKTMTSKNSYYMLILKSSKTIIAELTLKQEKQIVDLYSKENAPDGVSDGQFTDISGKVWNYSDVEKMYYISPNEYVHLDEIYQILLFMNLAQKIQLKKFCIPNITKNKKKKYFVTYDLTYHDDNVVKPIFTLGDMIEACKTK